jgi:hypothetical protein
MKSAGAHRAATAVHRDRRDRVAAGSVRVRRHATRRARVCADGNGRCATDAGTAIRAIPRQGRRRHGALPRWRAPTRSSDAALCRLAGLLGRSRRGQPGERLDGRRPVRRGNARGIAGALLDSRISADELIKYNLFDNSGTYRTYVGGRDGVAGPRSRCGTRCGCRLIATVVRRRRRRGVQMCKGN